MVLVDHRSGGNFEMKTEGRCGFETDLHEPLSVRSVLVCGSSGLEGWVVQVKSSEKDLVV